MSERGFFSKQDAPEFSIFDDDGIWFVERNTDHWWLAKDNSWTNDPLEAKQFKKRISALSDIIFYKLENCEPTQHEFPMPTNSEDTRHLELLRWLEEKEGEAAIEESEAKDRQMFKVSNEMRIIKQEMQHTITKLKQLWSIE